MAVNTAAHAVTGMQFNVVPLQSTYNVYSLHLRRPSFEVRTCCFSRMLRFKSQVKHSRVAASLTGQLLLIDQPKLPSVRTTLVVLQHMLTHMGGQTFVTKELAVSKLILNNNNRTNLHIDAKYEDTISKRPVCTA
eukprot:4414211-Amphidinium_carterae.2